MRSLLLLLEHHGVPDAAAKTLIIVALFAAAFIVARFATVIARDLERRSDDDGQQVSPLVAISRRETAVSLVQTSVRYLALLIALALAVVVLVGGHSIGTVAGASFIAVLIGFAAQRFLIDIMAGFVMFFEGWYTVGTSVVIEPWKLEGVVEEVSLRATAIRDVNGDLLRVHNSQILAVRVLPEGARRVEIEIYVRDGAAGERLLNKVGEIVPTGPTAFISPPTIRSTEQLDDNLYRISATASLAPGRLWLATDLLANLLKERAESGLLVHGPVILPADDQAISRFARSERRFRRR
ncbi:MAG TPA: mechanosensitive ion channel domain-containing protein [Gaiellaceae bacterium]|jgi:small conductance mechanosensitive channel